MANINLAAARWLSMLYAPDEPLRVEEFLARLLAPVSVGPGPDRWLVGWFLAPSVPDEDPRAVCGHCPVGAGASPPDELGEAHAIAAALMTAFAAAFVLLTALTLANEVTSFSSAETIVSTEAADASSLAWAAKNPGVDERPSRLPRAITSRRPEPVSGTAARSEM